MRIDYRLKSSGRAAVHGFRFGDFSGADSIMAKNDDILRDVYKRIQFGLSEYAYISDGDAIGGRLFVISRDPVYSGAVRVSVFIRFGSGSGAAFEASSHKTFLRVRDFLGYGLPSGRLRVVGGWYDDLLKGGAA